MENAPPEFRKDVLQELMESLPLRDYICFGAINPSWSAIAKKKLDHPRKQMQKVPWLVFKEDMDKDTTCFFNVFTKKLHHTEVQELRGRRFYGSSFGWLITVDINLDMYLLNPLSRVEIKLPKLFISSDDFAGDHYFDRATFTQRISLAEAVRNQFIRKVVLTADPGKTSDYVVIAVFEEGWDLAYLRPGDSAWTVKTNYGSSIIDVIWYKESIYYVCNELVHVVQSRPSVRCSIYVFDFNSNEGDDLSVEEVVPFEFRLRFHRRRASFKPYLVDIMGDLFMVRRKLVRSTRTPRREVTVGFEVFKMDQSQSPMQFIACESIGDHVLFLGCNNSIVVSTVEMDDQEGGLIYFTDDYFEATWSYCRLKDMGVYNMKVRRKFKLPNIVNSSLKFPPVFVEANPF